MNTLTAYILAGGKSSRMGTDKGLLLFQGKPIVSHIYNALFPIVGENIVIISANKAYDFLGCKRILDIVADKGPVGGIYTALNHTKTALNMIVSVDVPLVSTNLFQWIVDNHSNDIQLTQIESEGKSCPLIAVYDKSLENVFKYNLENNQLRLRQIIETIKHKTLEVPEKWQAQVQNINTKEEFQKITQ